MVGLPLNILKYKRINDKPSTLGGGKEITSILDFREAQLSAKTLAALGAAGVQDAAAANSSHTGAEAMTTLTNDFAGLIGALHVNRLILINK